MMGAWIPVSLVSGFRFLTYTHCPRKSPEEGMKRICHYLRGIKVHGGLEFKPTKHVNLDCYVPAYLLDIGDMKINKTSFVGN